MGSMGAAEAEVEGPAGRPRRSAGARPDYAAMDRGDAPGGADDDCAPGGAAADDDYAPTPSKTKKPKGKRVDEPVPGAQAWRARAQRITDSAGPESPLTEAVWGVLGAVAQLCTRWGFEETRGATGCRRQLIPLIPPSMGDGEVVKVVQFKGGGRRLNRFAVESLLQVLVSINMLGLICRIHEKQAAADPTAPPGGIYSGGKHCLTLLAFKRPADRDKLAVQLYRFYEKLLTYIGRWSQETGAPDHISALEFRCYNNKVGGLVEICKYIILNGVTLTRESTGLKALLAKHTVPGRLHRDGGSEAKSCTPDKVSAAGPPKPLPAPRHPSARPVGVARRRPGCRPELPLLFVRRARAPGPGRRPAGHGLT